MSGSADLHKNINDPFAISVPNTFPLQAYSDNYMINGAVRECHVDFESIPVGQNPNGFVVCQRKRDPITGQSPEEVMAQSNLGIPFRQKPINQGTIWDTGYTQTYDLYKDRPNSIPRYSPLGGQALKFQDRRLPYQAHLQGLDYYRDCIDFRAIGTEKIDAVPGIFGYKENKYYFSSPPPLFDITQAVQPYNLWRREQIRMGNFTLKEMENFEKQHTYKQDIAPTF